MTLRKNLIRLGAANPHLRKDLRVILAALGQRKRAYGLSPLDVSLHKAEKALRDYLECLRSLISNFSRFSVDSIEYIKPYAYQNLVGTHREFNALHKAVYDLMVLRREGGGGRRKEGELIKVISRLWSVLPRAHADIFKQFHGLSVRAKDLYFDSVDLKALFKKVEKAVAPREWGQLA